MINTSGINEGRVILRNVYQGEAPSTLAASKISLGKPLKPAKRTNIEKGSHCQLVMSEMEVNAHLGVIQLICGKPAASKS